MDAIHERHAVTARATARRVALASLLALASAVLLTAQAQERPRLTPATFQAASDDDKVATLKATAFDSREPFTPLLFEQYFSLARTDVNPDVRAAAVNLFVPALQLASEGDAQAAFTDRVTTLRPRLLSMLDDGDTKVVIPAINMYAQSEFAVGGGSFSSTFIRKLISLYRANPPIEVAATILMIGALADSRQLDELVVDELRSTDPSMRWGAIKAARYTTPRGATEGLATAAGDPDTQVRTAAIDALRAYQRLMPSTRSIAEARLAVEPERTIRRALETLISELKDPQMVTPDEIAATAYGAPKVEGDLPTYLKYVPRGWTPPAEGTPADDQVRAAACASDEIVRAVAQPRGMDTDPEGRSFRYYTLVVDEVLAGGFVAPHDRLTYVRLDPASIDVTTSYVFFLRSVATYDAWRQPGALSAFKIEGDVVTSVNPSRPLTLPLATFMSIVRQSRTCEP